MCRTTSVGATPISSHSLAHDVYLQACTSGTQRFMTDDTSDSGPRLFQQLLGCRITARNCERPP